MQNVTIIEVVVYSMTALFCLKLSYDFYKSDKEDKEYIERIKTKSC